MVKANIVQISDAWMIVANVGKKLKMKIMGKEINDECSKCGNILECELFRQGHGIKQERENSIPPFGFYSCSTFFFQFGQEFDAEVWIVQNVINHVISGIYAVFAD